MTTTGLKQGIAQEHPEWVIPRMCQKKSYQIGGSAAIIAGLMTTRALGLDKNRRMFAALGTSVVAGDIVSRYTYKRCQESFGFFEALHGINADEIQNR